MASSFARRQRKVTARAGYAISNLAAHGADGAPLKEGVDYDVEVDSGGRIMVTPHVRDTVFSYDCAPRRLLTSPTVGKTEVVVNYVLAQLRLQELR